MVKSFAIAIALATMAGAGAAADENDWTGFYTAIDAIDGSIDSLSIVAIGDDTYRIVMSSTDLAMCSDGTQPGVILATGRVVEDSLVREKVVAKCAGASVEQALPDGVYLRDEDTGVLMLNGTMGRENYYHPIGLLER